ncbi:Hypothetical_protein [Hexamita inflata]|uniref:Hypothetical_protein n=1 Tax=Hexamita inflata TaxID=28002 RepID=A0ABP1GKV5_9EUKA
MKRKLPQFIGVEHINAIYHIIHQQIEIVNNSGKVPKQLKIAQVEMIKNKGQSEQIVQNLNCNFQTAKDQYITKKLSLQLYIYIQIVQNNGLQKTQFSNKKSQFQNLKMKRQMTATIKLQITLSSKDQYIMRSPRQCWFRRLGTADN